MKILRIFCETNIKPLNPITFEELRNFLLEIELYLPILPDSKRTPFNEQIDFLKVLIQRIEALIKEERVKLKRNGKALSKKVFYAFIDITKEVTKYIHRQPVGCEKHLNQKRSSDQIQEIDSFEEIKKKIKSTEIYQLVFSSFGVEIQPKSQPPIKPEIPIQEAPEIQEEQFEKEFDKKKALKSLNDENKTNDEVVLENNKADGSMIETNIPSEKMQETEEHFNESNNEMLFDENFTFEEEFGIGRPDFDSKSYLDRLNEELWNDLDNGFKLKKKKKEISAHAQDCNNEVLERN